MTTKTSHTTCTHEATPKARAACRKDRAALEVKAQALLARLEGSPNMIRTAAGRLTMNRTPQVYVRDLSLIACCRIIVAAGWNYHTVCQVSS